MKKILLLLFLAYSYSFSITCTGTTYQFSALQPYSCNKYHFPKTPPPTCLTQFTNNHIYVGGTNGIKTYQFEYDGDVCPSKTVAPPMVMDYGMCYISNDTVICNSNPDPNGGANCREGFVKDGQYYNCNPNTNEAELVPNSNGYFEDEDGNEYPNCNEGFENNSDMNISNGPVRSYNSQSCVQSSDTQTPGTGDNGSFPDAPTTSTGADGSTSWTWDDGTTQTLSPNGTLTTYYPDGTNSVKQVGNDYTPSTGGTSGGGTATGGTGGTGGGGSGTNGNTTNETDTSNNNDNPIDETPVSNSCSDSSLTLQEKMLCEMNAGMKKLNSESSPENSLNNLINEMNKDNNTNTTAINTNIKETNKLLTDTKALNENQLSELKNVTKELKKLNASTGTTSSVVSPEVNPFEPAENDTGGLVSTFESDKSIIDSFTGIYTDFKNNLLGHQDTLNNLISNTTSTINGGIGLSLSTTEIINCPLNYNLDMTTTLRKTIPFNIDICEITSKTKPYLYPIFLIFFTVVTLFFAFRFIGVLL